MRIRHFGFVAAAVLLFSGALFALHTPSAQAVACSAGAPAQNDYTVAPSHGPVFYIDTGVTPALDAGYIGYSVTNDTGATQTALWAQVSSFTGTGNVLSLANSLDSMMKLPVLADGASGMSYFMLKATGATTAAQTHTFRVYDKRPDLAGASVLYECNFQFTRVKETIKAGSNKVEDNGYGTSAAIEVSDSSPALGQSITLTVEGTTGNIGSGSTPDFDILWLTPAAISSWPTRTLRLEGVSVIFDGNGNWANTGDQVTYTDQLLIDNANGLANVDGSEYRATYTFKVIGSPTASVTAVPVAQIASGTQVKHTDTGATGATVDLSFSALTINAALTKSVTDTTDLTIVDCTGACAVPGASSNGETYVEVPYRLTAATSSATTLTIDEMVDLPEDGIIYKPGSASITDIGRTDVAIDDPVYIASESELSPLPVHFVGPFTFAVGTNASLDYMMYVPVGSFENTAYAKIGDFLIGATSSAMSRITVTSTGDGDVGVVSDTVDFSVDAETSPATSITTTGAVLNGTIDANGTSVLTGQFQYGTSPTLVGATTVTATTPVSGTLNGLTDPTPVAVTLTGLSSGTTYYFRVIAGSAQGSILSFTTTAVLAAPTVATTAATAVATTTATLNGTINPNLTPITGIQFVYGTSPTLASGNTTVIVDDGSGLAALTAGGSSTQPFSYDITGLTAGTTYYFKIRACTSALSGSYPNHTCSTSVEGSILSFNASTTPSVTTSAATSVTGSSATLNGSVTANGADTTTSFTYGTVSDLSSGTSTASAALVSGTTPTAIDAAISGLAPGTTYYFRANGTNSNGSASGSILNFTTTGSPPTARTLTIDSGSYDPSYTAIDTPPTITSTPSAGAGTKSYTSTTTDVCTIAALTGVVTFVFAGTCTIVADITYDGTYAAATSDSISFEITPVARTLTIDSESYEASYEILDTPPTITSTPSAGAGTKSYTSTTTGVCTIDSSTGVVAFASTGTCTIVADIENDGTYDDATSESISFEITLVSRTLEIDSGSYDSSYDMLDTPPTITSTPSAGAGTKSYTSTTTSVCTIAALTGVVTFVSAGTCTIVADIEADGTYDDATSESISFEVAFVSRTLEIDSESYDESYTTNDQPPTITSTPSAGAGTKSYTSTTIGVCTIAALTGVVTFVSAGTCTIVADIEADGTYDDATSESISFEVDAPPSSPPPPYQPPSSVSMVIAGGSCSASSYVSLSLAGTNATHVIVSNDPLLAGPSYLAFIAPASSVPWLLPPGDGTRTVYVRFVNGDQQSATLSDSITVDTEDDCESPTPPPSTPPPTTPPPSTPPPSTPPPTTPPPASCNVSCSDLSYDMYIVNPDGTERHTGSPFVKVTDLGGGRFRYGFEDKGSDFDHNDVIIDADQSDCSDLRYSLVEVGAAWHHKVIVRVAHKGVDRLDAIILPDSHAALGFTKSVDAKNDPSMCIGEPLTAFVEEPVAAACRLTAVIPQMSLGQVSSVTTLLQEFLRCLGFFPANVPTSPRFGPVTQAAVTAFQIANGLPPVGAIGPRTAALLASFLTP